MVGLRSSVLLLVLLLCGHAQVAQCRHLRRTTRAGFFDGHGQLSEAEDEGKDTGDESASDLSLPTDSIIRAKKRASSATASHGSTFTAGIKQRAISNLKGPSAGAVTEVIAYEEDEVEDFPGTSASGVANNDGTKAQGSAASQRTHTAAADADEERSSTEDGSVAAAKSAPKEMAVSKAASPHSNGLKDGSGDGGQMGADGAEGVDASEVEEAEGGQTSAPASTTTAAVQQSDSGSKVVGTGESQGEKATLGGHIHTTSTTRSRLAPNSWRSAAAATERSGAAANGVEATVGAEGEGAAAAAAGDEIVAPGLDDESAAAVSEKEDAASSEEATSEMAIGKLGREESLHDVADEQEARSGAAADPQDSVGSTVSNLSVAGRIAALSADETAAEDEDADAESESPGSASRGASGGAADGRLASPGSGRHSSRNVSAAQEPTSTGAVKAEVASAAGAQHSNPVPASALVATPEPASPSSTPSERTMAKAGSKSTAEATPGTPPSPTSQLSNVADAATEEAPPPESADGSATEPVHEASDDTAAAANTEPAKSGGTEVEAAEMEAAEKEAAGPVAAADDADTSAGNKPQSHPPAAHATPAKLQGSQTKKKSSKAARVAAAKSAASKKGADSGIKTKAPASPLPAAMEESSSKPVDSGSSEIEAAPPPEVAAPPDAAETDVAGAKASEDEGDTAAEKSGKDGQPTDDESAIGKDADTKTRAGGSAEANKDVKSAKEDAREVAKEGISEASKESGGPPEPTSASVASGIDDAVVLKSESEPEVDASAEKGEGADLGQQEQGLWLQRVLAGQYTHINAALAALACVIVAGAAFMGYRQLGSVGRLPASSLGAATKYSKVTAAAPAAAEWDNNWGGDEAKAVSAPQVSARKPVLPNSLKSPTTASERPPPQAGAETASGWDEDW